MRRLLEANRPNGRTRKAARLAAREQRKEIKCTDLALKARARRAGCGRGDEAGGIGVILAHEPIVFRICSPRNGGFELCGRLPRLWATSF